MSLAKNRAKKAEKIDAPQREAALTKIVQIAKELDHPSLNSARAMSDKIQAR